MDEDGLLIGRWDGDYRDGMAPHAWTGTVAIMEKYLRDGGEPVKYGQCWVFSGAVVTGTDSTLTLLIHNTNNTGMSIFF